VDQGEHGPEVRAAVDEAGGAVDRVEQPVGPELLEPLGQPRVGGDGLLADDRDTGVAGPQALGDQELGLEVRDGDGVVRARRGRTGR